MIASVYGPPWPETTSVVRPPDHAERNSLDRVPTSTNTHPVGITQPSASCRSHHGAYDQLLLGIDPDLCIEVNEEILKEIDGPMLRHGLQEMHGRQILTPRHQRDHPDRDRLAWKYSRFRDRIA